MELKEGGRKTRRFQGHDGGGAGWDKLVQEAMVVLWFMFKLFFIKSNLRFYLSSFFFVFFVFNFMVFWSHGSGALSAPSLWSPTEDKECRLCLAVGTKPPASPSPGRAALPTQEDKVESFCVCCACERCMDFWLSTSLKCFSTCRRRNTIVCKATTNRITGWIFTEIFCLRFQKLPCHVTQWLQTRAWFNKRHHFY